MQDGSAENLGLVREAVARNAALVLSLPSAGMLRHHKSRFLGEQLDGATGAGFWVESTPGERPLIDELIASRKPVGASFKSGVDKVLLAAPLLARDPAYPLNANTTIEAVLLALPEQVRAVQRRNNYRVRIGPADEAVVRVWRIGEKTYLGDRPKSEQEIPTEPRDLSVGGVGVVFKAKDGKPPQVCVEDRLRVELTIKDVTLLLEGKMRKPSGSTPDGSLRTGVQFKNLESDLQGRQKLAQLTKIVGALQREEVRRTRLGLNVG